METPIPGLHHVTMIARDAQQNLDFYTKLLGLRLVKKTINFDDPGTYHFYYGDRSGTPGTILTFFPISLAHDGVRGAGQTTTITLAVPPGSLGWWAERLTASHVVQEGIGERFGERYLTFYDPDGLRLELVEAGDIPGYAAPDGGAVPVEQAIRGVYSVTLQESDPAATVALLTDSLGFRFAGQEGTRTRYMLGEEGTGRIVEIEHLPNSRPGVIAAGSVHHIAFRIADDPAQVALQEALMDSGYGVTEVKDRQYFHSIYFREPGGALFEIATDPPGFLLDESVETLGTALKLPPWLEMRRALIERQLPKLSL